MTYQVLTYPDIHANSIICNLELCTRKHKAFWRHFLVLFAFSVLSLVPMTLLHLAEAKLLIAGLFGGRVIELIGEALVAIGKEV